MSAGCETRAADVSIVYFNGRFMPKQEVRISPDDRGFLFADGVYEVIRSYHGRLFRAEDHLARLARSLKELQIAVPDLASVRTTCEQLLSLNGLRDGDATVYFQVTRGVAPRTHAFPRVPPVPTLYGYAASFSPPRLKWERGVKVILVSDTRWARCDIKSVALLPNALAAQRAQQSGAEEAVFVRDGAIMEGSHTSFCAVVRGQLVTAPESNCILPGITRRVVLELCAAVGIPVQQFPLLEPQVRNVDEIMLLGTTSEVMPVIQVDDWTVADGRPGPVTRRLQNEFGRITEVE